MATSTTTQFEKVTTKEELEDLRRRLDKQNSAMPPEYGTTPEGTSSWSGDRDSIVQFLEDLQKIMEYLLTHRVPNAPRALFEQSFVVVKAAIGVAITQLSVIDSDEHVIYAKLREADLTGSRLKLKLREFRRRIATSPATAVLAIADRILGSLASALPVLEPVKEFKETLEERLRNDGDAGLQDLGLAGDWRSAE
jgi:hypothetical protein